MSTNAHEAAAWVRQHGEPVTLDGPIALPGSVSTADVLGLASTTRLTSELTVAAHLNAVSCCTAR